MAEIHNKLLIQEMVITDRQLRVSDMYLKGMQQSEIAAHFGVTQQCVSKDIRSLIDIWKKYALQNINDLIQVELERINHLELTYWDAWEASKQEKTTLTAKVKTKNTRKRIASANAPSEETSSKRTEERQGDPRYLAGVQWCIDRRIKLLGLDPPESLNVSTVGAAPVVVVGFDTDKI